MGGWTKLLIFLQSQDVPSAGFIALAIMWQIR